VRVLCAEAARLLGRSVAVREKKAAMGRIMPGASVLPAKTAEYRRRKDGWAQDGAAPRLGVEI
jgi:hypothetical protein